MKIAIRFLNSFGEYKSEVVMKKKIEKLIKKYERQLWRSQYKKSALEVMKNNLSKYGYWDLGYFDGRASLYEDIIEDLEELLEKESN